MQKITIFASSGGKFHHDPFSKIEISCTPVLKLYQITFDTATRSSNQQEEAYTMHTRRMNVMENYSTDINKHIDGSNCAWPCQGLFDTTSDAENPYIRER